MTSSNQSFVPRPSDWGQMNVTREEQHLLLIGQDGRSLEITGQNGRRPVVTYTPPNTSPFTTQGNILNSGVRKGWAKDIAGPSADLQVGVAADLNQAAAEWHQQMTEPKETRTPSAAELAEDAFERLCQCGRFYASAIGEATYWLESKTGKLHSIASTYVRDRLFEMLDLVPAQWKSEHVISGLQSLARTRGKRVTIHALTDPRPMSVAERAKLRTQLVAWLKRHGLTQQELAARLGVSPRTIRHWVGGTRAIPRFLPLALRALADDLAHERRRKRRKP